jgi:organic radical activating enzyme
MSVVFRCFAASQTQWSGREQIAPQLPQFATPTLTARWAAATARPTNRRIPSPRKDAEKQNRYVVLTSGEPLLQVDTPLIDALCARLEIGIETNGTIEPPDGSIVPRKPAPTSSCAGVMS